MSVSNQIRLVSSGDGPQQSQIVERRNIEILHGKSTEYYSKNPTLKLTVSGGTSSKPFHWTQSLCMAWIQTLENRYRYQQQKKLHLHPHPHSQPAPSHPSEKKNDESTNNTSTTNNNGITLRLNNMVLNPYLQKWFEKSTIGLDLICSITTNDLEHLYLISIALKGSGSGEAEEEEKEKQQCRCQNLKSVTIKVCIQNYDAFNDNEANNNVLFGLFANEEMTSGGRFLQQHQQSIQQFCDGIASHNCCLTELNFDIVCFGMERAVRKYLAKPLAEGLHQNQSIQKLILGGGWDNKSFAILLDSLVPSTTSITTATKRPAPAGATGTSTTTATEEKVEEQTPPVISSQSNKISCLELNGVSVQAMVQSGHIKDSFENIWKYNNTNLKELIFNSCFEEVGNDNRGKLMTVWLSMQQDSNLQKLRLIDMNLQTEGMSRILPALCCSQQLGGKTLFENLEILDISNNQIVSLEFVTKLLGNDGFVSSSALPSLKAILLHDNPALKLIENLGGKYPITTTNKKKQQRNRNRNRSRNSYSSSSSSSSSQLYLRISKQQQYDNYQYIQQLMTKFPKLNQFFPTTNKSAENHKLQPIFCGVLEEGGHHHFRGLLDYQQLIPSIWPYYFELANDIYDFSSCIESNDNNNNDDDDDDQSSNDDDDSHDDSSSDNTTDENNNDNNNNDADDGDNNNDNSVGNNNDDVTNTNNNNNNTTTKKKNDLDRNIAIDRATSIFCLVRIASSCGVFEDHHQKLEGTTLLSGAEQQQQQQQQQKGPRRRLRVRKQKHKQTKQKSFFGRLFRSKRK